MESPDMLPDNRAMTDAKDRPDRALTERGLEVTGKVVQTGLQTGQVVVTRALKLYPWRLIVPTAVFVVVFAVVLSLGEVGDLRFYQASATIVVVLVLSLSTQANFFLLKALPAPPEWVQRLGRVFSLAWLASERFTVIAILGYLGVGEAAALYALATRTRSTLLLAVAAGAIASGFVAVGALALAGQEEVEAVAEAAAADEGAAPATPAEPR
jgi:hypothetical protein